ncbi:lactate dehydrogenase [Sphingobacterium composti Ten et al. 2007 non Yoo et al. 2007]|uniref:lactate dehydrogenase n=1 Tax=Sphingobacterium composti TaxID=363260 RepID=UPI00135945EF|nr:lactate dehydrogenase [Sphingobacterium composti Ten et al. 2007 non Yoo et al. 2007]
MRVVAYNIQEFEKQTLAKANAKVHDLTLISNPLNLATIRYAVGKEVVIVSANDKLDKEMLQALSAIGVKKIITRSVSLNHIDVSFANKLGLHVANTPAEDDSPKNIAIQTIDNLNNWLDGQCFLGTCQCKIDSSVDKRKLHTKRKEYER